MKNKLFTQSFLLATTGIALFYIILTVLLINGRLVLFTVTTNASFATKSQLIFSLITGMFSALSPLSIFLLFLSGILTGANIALAIQKISLLRKMGQLQLTVGGGLLLGIAGSGCAACGLPIVSLLGLTGGVALLPFHGEELSFASVILLSTALILLLKSFNEIACIMPPKKDLTKK